MLKNSDYYHYLGLPRYTLRDDNNVIYCLQNSYFAYCFEHNFLSYQYDKIDEDYIDELVKELNETKNLIQDAIIEKLLFTLTKEEIIERLSKK